ncbi:helix-turn-helix domain-containing protein [Dethiothermospora halolimnae]
MKLKIKELRMEKGLTVRELSALSEVSIGYISELENGFGSKENPSLEVI